MVSLAVLHSRLAWKSAGAGALDKAMSEESKVRKGDLCGSQEMRKGGREGCHRCSIVELEMRLGD